jgi:hypothetical protein
MHPSFEPVDRNGTYYRRIKDIRRGLKELGIVNSPNENKGIQFLGNFFGCEKLAIAIVGIREDTPIDEVFDRGPSSKNLKLDKLRAAREEWKLNVAHDHLTWLFNDDRKLAPLDKPPPDPFRLSAKQLRNKVVHHFGPYIVGLIIERWDFFAPKMAEFLACDEQVLRYLEEKWRSRYLPNDT